MKKKREGVRKTTSKFFLKLKKNEHEIVFVHEVAHHFDVQKTQKKKKKRKWLRLFKPKTILELIMQILEIMF